MLLVGKLRVCRVVADKRILNNVLRIRSVRADIERRGKDTVLLLFHDHACLCFHA